MLENLSNIKIAYFMGLIVDAYPTKWGLTTPAYISLASSQVNMVAVLPATIAEMAEMREKNTQWCMYTDFAVYKSKEDRLDNPASYLEKITVRTVVDSSIFDTRSVFDVLYDTLGQLYSGVRD